MLNNELIAFLFDGNSSTLSACMVEWLASSRRYAAFVDTHRDKIRKKIRVAQDSESLLDLQLELETAFLLLQEKTLSVMYEPDHAKRIARAPDFAVTYTTSLTFSLEVTRMRGDFSEKISKTEAKPVLSVLQIRMADTICSKLGQLQPKQPNILLIGMDAPPVAESDLRAAMLHIQNRAERDDPAFLKRYGFQDRTEFFSHYHRLSEVFVRVIHAMKPAIWINPQAKHPLPSRVRTALYRSYNE
jgi:hypothetical protein